LQPTDESAAARDRRLLPCCPECEYDLTGLPAAHYCPECGFEFKAETVAFRGQRPRGVVFSILGALATLWVVVSAAAALVTDRFIDPCTICLGVAIGLAWWHWWRRRAPHYILLTRNELLYRERSRVKRRWKWSDVGYAEYSTLGRCIYVFDRENHRIGDIPYVGQEHAARAAAICGMISLWVRRHGVNGK
jgi:hypothetical protein